MKYGPNTEKIEALIEKARNLTPEQVESLGAARDAARGDARSAAWYAARDAARGAAWHAAWYAARDAARDAAWYAVWDVVMALLAQGLISKEHFAILSGPWDSVMK